MGFLGGLLGVGGGVFVVPALFYVFDQFEPFSSATLPANTTAVVAIASSLATIVFTTLASAIAQQRQDAIDWSIVRRWAPFLAVGSYAASLVGRSLPSLALKLTFATFITIMAIFVISQWTPKESNSSPGWITSSSLATGGGFIAGIVGLGSANFVVPTLLYFNATPVNAVATASALGFIVALFGSLGYAVNGWSIELQYATGYVYWPVVAPIVLGSVLLAPVGVYCSHRMPQRALRIVFGVLMLAIAINLFSSIVF